LHFENAIIKKMMEMDVDGYLLKNADSKEVINAIRIVADGKKYFSGEVTMSFLKNKITSQPLTLSNDLSEKLALLSDREIEILKTIAEGYSSKEIAQQLFISHRTVETHRTNIMKKLELKKLAGLIKFAFQTGLVK
jgi:DNA-binding NarL/FixJ family response regulator